MPQKALHHAHNLPLAITLIPKGMVDYSSLGAPYLDCEIWAFARKREQLLHAKGALFEVGDGHAGQGNGEVDITALETQLTGTFQFIVHKDQHLLWPRAETPTQYIAMGFDEDLKTATEMAVRNMITFLAEEIPDQIPGHPRLTRDDAYALISTACDVDITQLVDTKSGVHVMCPKKLFTTPISTH